MYTAFYDLELKPFQISSDPSFIWLGEKHKEALAVLRYGVLDNKGFLLLTGDVGTGKTTLLNSLIASLGDDVIYASVPDPRLVKIEFFNYIADAFGLKDNFKSKGRFLKSFSQFLRSAYNNKKKVLLLIDESQLLTQDLLEEIRLLSNIEVPNSQLLNIFFVGQNEFNEVISREENRAVAQRLTLNYYLEPLSLHETEQYITHRLKIAGTARKIFDSSAIREIHSYSGGFPRRINIICDHCLLTGYVKESKTINAPIVIDCAKELTIPKHNEKKLKEARPARIQQPLHQQPAAQYHMPPYPPQPYPQPQPVPQPVPQAVVRGQEGKTFSPVRVFLFIVFLAALAGFMFPEFFTPYYNSARKYITMLQTQLDAGRTEGQGEHEQAGSQGTSAESSPPAPLPQPLDKANSGTGAKRTSPDQDKTTIDTIPASKETGSAAISEETGFATSPGEQQSSPSPRTTGDDLTSEPFLQEKIIIRFPKNSNYFNPVDIGKLKNFALRLIADPDTIALVYGYTDNTGTDRYNEKISEFRANIVRGFLLGQGVPPEQMRSEGRGNQNPVDDNTSPEGRENNRRVEITVIPR